MNQTLEAYVHSATAHLPESDRMLEQREMHQHLSALIAAHEELGDTTETATEAALKQLGDARVIREELLKTHRRAKFYGLMNRPLSEFWTFYSRRRLTAFRQSWIGAIVCTIFAIYSVYTFVPMVLDLVYNPRNPANNQTVLEWYGFALFFLQCWLWGWLSSLLSGRRCLPVIASLVSTSAEIH